MSARSFAPCFRRWSRSQQSKNTETNRNINLVITRHAIKQSFTTSPCSVCWIITQKDSAASATIAQVSLFATRSHNSAAATPQSSSHPEAALNSDCTDYAVVPLLSIHD